MSKKQTTGFVEVEAPDGSVIEFPSSMSKEDIEGAMRKLYPPQDISQRPAEYPITTGLKKSPEVPPVENPTAPTVPFAQARPSGSASPLQAGQSPLLSDGQPQPSESPDAQGGQGTGGQERAPGGTSRVIKPFRPDESVPERVPQLIAGQRPLQTSTPQDEKLAQQKSAEFKLAKEERTTDNATLQIYSSVRSERLSLKEEAERMMANQDQIPAGQRRAYDAKMGDVLDRMASLKKREEDLKEYADEAIQRIVDEESMIASNTGDPLSMEREGAGKVADPTRIKEAVELHSQRLGIEDEEFKKNLYNRLKQEIDIKPIRESAEKRAQAMVDDLFKNELGGAKLTSTAESINVEAAIGLDSLKSSFENDYERAMSVFRSQASQAAKELNGGYEQQVAALQLALDAGQIDAQTANARVSQLHEEYSKNFIAVNDALLKEANAVNMRYNQKYREEQKRIIDDANKRIEAANKEFDSKVKDPKLRERIKAIYKEAWGATIAEQAEAIAKAEQGRREDAKTLAGLYNPAGAVMLNASEIFTRTTITSFGGAIKGLSETLGSETGYVWGEELERAYYMPRAEAKELSDLLDYENFAALSGQLAGAMTPSLAASAGVAVSTKGAGLPISVRLLATSLAGWGAETADISGRAKDQMFAQTGDIQKAKEAQYKSFASQVQLLPAYALEGLPFVGGALRFIPSKAGRVLTGAGMEYLTEAMQEIPQNIAERNILAGRDAWDEFAQGLLDPENKEVLISMAPIAILGAGGQLNSTSAKQDLQKAVKAYIGKGAVANHVDGAAAQWVTDMMIERGDNFTTAVITSLLTSGHISEAQALKLDLLRTEAQQHLDEAERAGLNEREAKVYAAFASQISDLTKKSDQETSPSMKRALDARIKELTQATADFINRKEANYVEVSYADGRSSILDMASAARMFGDPSFARVVSLLGQGKAGIGIKASGAEAAALVDGFAEKVAAQKPAADEGGKKEPAPQETPQDTPQVAEVEEDVDVRPVLEQVRAGEFINDEKLKAAEDRLYDIADDIDKRTDLSPEQKAQMMEVVESNIQKLQDYGFRTRTETRTVTQAVAAASPRPTTGKESRGAQPIATAAADGIAVTLDDGVSSPKPGVIKKENGQYVFYQRPSGAVKKFKPVVLGDAAVVDGSVQFAGVENPTKGPVATVAKITMPDGQTLSILDDDLSIDAALHVKKMELGATPQEEFDVVFNEVTTENQVEVPYLYEPQRIPKREQQQKSQSGALPNEIQSLKDDQIVTLTYKSLDQVPESLRQKAMKTGGGEITTRKSILGIPVGKERTVRTPEAFVVAATGAEVKEAASAELAKTGRISAMRSDAEDEAFNGIEEPKTPIGDTKTVVVDGVERTVFNSEGRPIHPTVEGVRNFWRWFGDSKVVDEQGRPLVVYHGTNKDFNEFVVSPMSQHLYGNGIYVTPYVGEAESYARHEGGNILPLYVRLSSPVVLRKNTTDIDRWVQEPVQGGRRDLPTGLIIVSRGNKIELAVAANSNDVKSATGNYGTFNPQDARINAMKSDDVDSADRAKRRELIKKIGRMTDEKAFALAKALVPDLKIVRHDTEESLQAAIPPGERSGKVGGFYHWKNKTIHIGPSKDGQTHVLSHELMHPIFDAFIGADDAKLDRLYNELVSNPEFNMFKLFGERYLKDNDGKYKSKVEAIVDFLGAVADGKFDEQIEKDKTFKDKLRDFVNSILRFFGLNSLPTDLTDVTTLKDLMKLIAAASKYNSEIRYTEITPTDRDGISTSKSEEEETKSTKPTTVAELKAKYRLDQKLSKEQEKERMRQLASDFHEFMAQKDAKNKAEKEALKEKYAEQFGKYKDEVKAILKEQAAQLKQVNRNLRNAIVSAATAVAQGMQAAKASTAAGIAQGKKEAAAAQKQIMQAVHNELDALRLDGSLTLAQARLLADAAADVNFASIQSLENFYKVVDRVINDSAFAAKVTRAKKLQKKARQRNHPANEERVNKFTRANPRKMTEQELDDYLQALKGLARETPRYFDMEVIYDSVMGYAPVKRQQSAEKTKEKLEKLRVKATTTDPANTDGLKDIISSTNALIRGANAALSNGTITPDEHAELLKDIPNTQEALEQKYAKEIKAIKDDLVLELEILRQSGKIDVSNKGIHHQNLVKRYEDLTEAQLLEMNVFDLAMLYDVAEAAMADGIINVQMMSSIVSKAEAQPGIGAVAKQIEAAKTPTAKFREQVDRKLETATASFWEYMLGLGSVKMGAMWRHVFTPARIASSESNKKISEASAEFLRLKEKYSIGNERLEDRIQRNVPLMDRNNDTMHRLGMVVIYLQEYGRHLSTGSQTAGRRDWFDDMKTRAADWKDAKEAEAIQRIWKAMPKTNGKVDPKDVYESFIAGEPKYLTKKELGFLREVLEWKEKNLAPMQQYANELRGKPMEMLMFHMPLIRVGSDADVKGAPRYFAQRGGLLSIESATGMERLSDEITPVRTNFEKLFFYNAEQVAVDYYFTPAIQKINHILSNAAKKTDRSKKQYYAAAATLLESSMIHEFTKASVYKLVRNAFRAKTITILAKPFRILQEFFTATLFYPLRTGAPISVWGSSLKRLGMWFARNRSGLRVTMDLMEDAKSALTNKENFRRVFEFRDGEYQKKMVFEKLALAGASLPETAFSVSSWEALFEKEFQRISGKPFDRQRYRTDREGYVRQNRAAIEEAGSVADGVYERISGPTTQFSARKFMKLPALNKYINLKTTWGYSISWMSNFPARAWMQNMASMSGLTRLEKEVRLSGDRYSKSEIAKDAAAQAVGVIGETLMYTALTSLRLAYAPAITLGMIYALKQAVRGYDDEEEERARVAYEKAMREANETLERSMSPQSSLIGATVSVTSLWLSQYGAIGRDLYHVVGSSAYTAAKNKMFGMNNSDAKEISKLVQDITYRKPVYIKGKWGTTEFMEDVLATSLPIVSIYANELNNLIDASGGFEYLMDRVESGKALTDPEREAMAVTWLWLTAINTTGTLMTGYQIPLSPDAYKAFKEEIKAAQAEMDLERMNSFMQSGWAPYRDPTPVER